MAIPIQEWLRGIDLERYEVNFLYGGYDTVDQCLGLTESDLVTLDITSSGHIKVLLANLNFLKKLNPCPQKPVAKVRQIKETNSGKEESPEIIYTNMDFNPSYNCPRLNTDSTLSSNDNDQLYTNVDFDKPVKEGLVRLESASFQKKKPVPAPRVKSICDHPLMTLSDVNTYDDVKCLEVSTLSETKCSNHSFDQKHSFNRSTSLPTNSFFGINSPSSAAQSNENSIPKKIILDSPVDQKPLTYVNVVHPFKKSDTENISTGGDVSNLENGLVTEYENYSFDERATLPKPDKQSNSSATSLNLSKKFSLPESHGPPSGELNLSHFKPVSVRPTFHMGDVLHHDFYTASEPIPMLPSKGQDQSPRNHSDSLFSEMDLSYLDNLSVESLENKARDLLDESSDSLPSRQSLPPPPYPPPPLVRSSAEAEGGLYPMLPPRPGSKKKLDWNGEPKNEDQFLPQPLVPLTPPDLPKHSPTSPRKSRPLPNISGQDFQKDPSVLTVVNQKLPEKELDLYSLETLPSCKDVPQITSKSQPSRQAPKHPKKETFIKMESPLTKQGETRWFILDRENLCYYNNEKQMSLIEAIPVRKVASVSSNSDNKCELSFEVFMKTSNSMLQLTADNLKWKFDWLVKIARLIACVCEEDLMSINSFQKAGNVYMKFLAADWGLKWIHLSGKTLFIYLEDDCFHEVDLKKPHTIRTLPSSSGSKMATEDSQPIQIETPDMKLCFQGWTKLDTTSWLKSIHNAVNFLDPSNLYDHHLTPSDVPVIVDKCITFVAQSGMETEGIYRISGQNSKVTKLLEMLNSDARSTVIRPDEFQVHDVSNCLKRFFRQLSDPLLTRKFYSCWIEALAQKDVQKRLTAYKNLLVNLPKINYATIKFTMTHLVEIISESEANKMDSVNIASIFGPIFVSAEKGEMTTAGYQSTNQEISIIKDFLDNHEFLFDMNEKDRQIEKTIRETRKRIERLNQTGVSDAEQDIQTRGMLVSISIENDNSTSTERDVVTIQVSPSMTASDLEGPIREKVGRRDYTDWRLFEVVCDGELERLIGQDENILSLLLKYKDWPQELCTNNSIIFKKTDLLNNLRLCLEPKMFLWEDLRFAMKKSFKKCYFEFTRCNLSYRKDPKASIMDSWRIEDLEIYSGVQKRRSPPTQFGITFYPINLQLSGNLLGFSICFRNPCEMYKWLAVLLNAQQPNGLFVDKKKSPAVLASESCPNLPYKVNLCPLPPTIEENFSGDMNKLSEQWDVKYEEPGVLTLASSSSSSSSSSRPTSMTKPQHSRPLPRLPAEGASGPALLTTTTSCTNINEPQARVSVMTKFLTKFTRNKEKAKE